MYEMDTKTTFLFILYNNKIVIFIFMKKEESITQSKMNILFKKGNNFPLNELFLRV